MQHSYEALDRPGGFSRVGLLVPLRSRNFRLLWSAMTVSLIGDGIFLIAMVWQAYALWNAPAALAVLGIGMTVPTIACLLLGGAISDRLDRRHILLYSDLARALVVGVLAALSIAGALSFALLVVLVALYGVGTAFFTPAFEAIVPDIVPQADLAQGERARSVRAPVGTPHGRTGTRRMARRVARSRAGLCARRRVVRSIGRDRSRIANHATGREDSRLERDGDRGRASASCARTCGCGGRSRRRRSRISRSSARPRCSFPTWSRTSSMRSAGDLGLVFAAGGVGAVGAAVLMAQRGHPKRDMTTMYACWTLATLAVAGYGLARSTIQLMLACLVFNALEAAGTIIWATIKQLHVPASLLGRVSSLDWLISIGFLPISFALTAPAADLIGVRNTLIVAAFVGSAATLGALFIPGLRAIEDTEPIATPATLRVVSPTGAQDAPAATVTAPRCCCVSSPLTGREPCEAARRAVAPRHADRRRRGGRV